MTQEDFDRQYMTWAADMRMRGVHPDWIYVWLGANEINQEFFDWVHSTKCPWPNDAHMSKPKDNPTYTSAYVQGKLKWEEMQKRLENHREDQDQ